MFEPRWGLIFCWERPRETPSPYTLKAPGARHFELVLVRRVVRTMRSASRVWSRLRQLSKSQEDAFDNLPNELLLACLSLLHARDVVKYRQVCTSSCLCPREIG